MMRTACSSFGSLTVIGWKRRSSAESFSRCLRYSSMVVAPMTWISPRDSGGFRIAAASMEPSAEPAPMSVCISSMNRMTSPASMHLFDALLQALLELAAVLAARHERRHVERDEALAAQDVGHLVRYDELGEALGDGGFADARLADDAAGCSSDGGKGSA